MRPNARYRKFDAHPGRPGTGRIKVLSDGGERRGHPPIARIGQKLQGHLRGEKKVKKGPPAL